MEEVIKKDLKLNVPHVILSEDKGFNIPENVIKKIYEKEFSYDEFKKISSKPIFSGEYGLYDTGWCVSLARAPYVCRQDILNPAFLKESGWKLHLAIDDTDEKNLSIAWNIFRDVVTRHKIWCAKFLSSKTGSLKDTSQNGKQATIYMFQEPDNLQENNQERWFAIINELEKSLAAAGVKSGEPAKDDLKIPGAKYVTYCCDQNVMGEYTAISHERLSDDNPFKDFTLVGESKSTFSRGL